MSDRVIIDTGRELAIPEHKLHRETCRIKSDLATRNCAGGTVACRLLQLPQTRRIDSQEEATAGPVSRGPYDERRPDVRVVGIEKGCLRANAGACQIIALLPHGCGQNQLSRCSIAALTKRKAIQ